MKGTAILFEQFFISLLSCCRVNTAFNMVSFNLGVSFNTINFHS